MAGWNKTGFQVGWRCGVPSAFLYCTPLATSTGAVQVPPSSRATQMPTSGAFSCWPPNHAATIRPSLSARVEAWQDGKGACSKMNSNFTRQTIVLLVMVLVCVWLNIQRAATLREHAASGDARRRAIDANRSDADAHILSAEEADELVNLAAARLAKQQSSAEDAARLELQDRLPFEPYWEQTADAERAAADGPFDDAFSYRLLDDGDESVVLEGRSQCGSWQRRQRQRFERAFRDYVKLHEDMISGRVPAKFVHVGMLHKSSLQNNIKVKRIIYLLLLLLLLCCKLCIAMFFLKKTATANVVQVATSVVLLGMATGRAALISWQRHLDPESQYYERRGW